MSGRAVARRAVVMIAAAFVLVMPARANDAAHTMAEKFAAEAQRTEASKREAEIKAEEARKQEAQRNAEAARKAAEAKRRADGAKAAEDARRAAERRQSEESDMLARARREADEMRAADDKDRLTEEARRLINEAEKERAKAEELLASQRTDEPRSKAREQRPAELERERAKAAEEDRLAQARAEETRRLAEKLNRVRQIRDARLAAQARRAASNEGRTPPVESSSRANADTAAPPAPVETATPAPRHTPPPASDTAATASAAAAPPLVRGERSTAVADSRAAESFGESGEVRVTVLLVMVPGDRGIRRTHKVADPLICTLDGCYVSAGAERPAVFMPGRKALGLANTWGARAGACRDKLGCVFRGVALFELPSYLQPIDMRVIKHDRRRGQVITGDSGCRADAGRLFCSRGLYADDYAMWIVPETVAAAAGAAVLERAVVEGLNGPRSADLSTRPGR